MSRTRRLKLRMSLSYRLWRFFVGALIAILAFVVSSAGALWFITLPRFALAPVVVTGTTVIRYSAIAASIATYFEKPVMYLIPRTTVFTASRAGIEETLKKNFPQLLGASVRSLGSNRLEIFLTDRTPASLWQIDYSMTASSTPALYLVDSSGFIFAKSDKKTTPTSTPFLFVGGFSEDQAIGRYVLPEDHFVWVESVRSKLSSMGVHVISVRAGTSGDLDFMTNEGWFLKVNSRDDNRAIARALEAVLSVIPAREEARVNGRSALEYVDIRFPNKAYFRLRKDAPKEIQASIP